MRAFRCLTLAAALALALAACGRSADQRYDYPAWGFSVVFTAPPRLIEAAATPQHVASFEAKVDSDERLIKQVIVVDTAPNETLESITQDHAAHYAAAMSGAAAAATVVATPEGVVGREVRFSSGGDPVFISRYFLVGRRLYELDASAVDGFDDPRLASFLNSLRITGSAPAAANAA